MRQIHQRDDTPPRPESVYTLAARKPHSVDRIRYASLRGRNVPSFSISTETVIHNPRIFLSNALLTSIYSSLHNHETYCRKSYFPLYL